MLDPFHGSSLENVSQEKSAHALPMLTIPRELDGSNLSQLSGRSIREQVKFQVNPD